jgi:hypothetical protein
VATLYDKAGIPIEPGDVLKVFHFIGARGKRHYMYKQAVAYTTLPKGSLWLKISHLNRPNDEPWEIGKNYYLEFADERVLGGYEIVDSIDASFEVRPRKGAAEHAARLADFQKSA